MSRRGLWRRLGRLLDRGLRDSASGMLAWEHRELENLFALLVLAPAAGVPGPPSGVALELLPDLERELTVLLARARGADDPWGELFSVFEVV